MNQIATFILKVKISASSEEMRDKAIELVEKELPQEKSTYTKVGCFVARDESCTFEHIEADK